MLKPFLALSAVTLFAIAAFTPTHAVIAGTMPQDAAQSPVASIPANNSKSTPASRERAKKIYAMDCALCHGDNGNGKTDLAKDMQLTMADWTDPKTLANRSDQELFNVIRNGKDKMPSEADSRAKNDEVWGLIAYIRGISKNQPAETAPKPADAPAPPADAPKPNR
jgi:mono/diheme cytochrome c family protein